MCSGSSAISRDRSHASEGSLRWSPLVGEAMPPSRTARSIATSMPPCSPSPERAWVVDASKWPAQALALHGPEIDLRVVHLVRDIRGVAYSLRKEHVARPHVTGEQSEMVHSGLTTTAWSWNKTQMLVELLRMNGLPVTRMRYEDLVATPEATIRLALSQLSVPLQADALDHVGQTAVHLGPSHGLSGNPSRFQIGTVRLRPDTAWQGGLSPIQSEALVVASVPQTIVGAVARLVTHREDREDR